MKFEIQTAYDFETLDVRDINTIEELHQIKKDYENGIFGNDDKTFFGLGQLIIKFPENENEKGDITIYNEYIE